MEISIVIVNYRGWSALDQCLQSLTQIKSPDFSFEVIIVDNYSNDGKLSDFKKKYSEFTFLENSGNNGFSNGCNYGAANSEGDYILFLNPDTTLSHNALHRLLKTSASNPSIGILSCLQVNENGKYYKLKNLFPSFSRLFGLSRALYKKFNKKKLDQKFAISDSLFYPDWVTGAVVFMSREWFNKVHGWNEDYWLYLEDVDICKKVHLQKGVVAVDTRATIFHKHGGASRINLSTKAITKTEVKISKHVYIHNHFPSSTKAASHTLLIFANITEKGILSILSIFLFFLPKIKVNRLILHRLIKYYTGVVKFGTWISPRSVNYKPQHI